MGSVTPAEMLAVGALGGTVEVIMMQPMVALKNALQEGRPIPTHPKHLYRGLTMNILSMAPITASQFGTNRLIQQLMGKADGDPLTGFQRFSSAAIAGAASAFIASPSELVIIHQQKSGRTLTAETQQFLSKHGLLALRRGLLPAIGRETLYAAGYLGLFPILKEYLDANYSKQLPPGASLLIAGITGGFFGAACSHPFDTAKTRMQAYMYSKPEYSTLRSTIHTIVAEGGVINLWSGLLPRMTRIIAACFILNYVRTNSIDFIEDNRRQQ